jgi:FkbM family methyltransferase
MTGWRMLLEGTCDICAHDYLQDLPAGHGLVYPTTLDLHTGETIDDAGAVWFARALRGIWEHPDGEPVRFHVSQRTRRDHVVLLNCLDAVYGHSLLKLLNAQRHRDKDLVLLVPEALEALVPEWVDETWIIREPISRFRGWLIDLEEAIGAELERFAHCDLSPAYPHPHPSSYDFGEFVATVEPKRVGSPAVVLSLRDDRRWGRTGKAQARNVGRLAERLRRRFPDVGFVAVGIGGDSPLPSDVDDRRSLHPTTEEERSWLELLRGADLVIGVHGSNMLLPSGLAAATLELQPRFRFDHVFQAMILREDDPLEALANHRVLYGNDRLSSLSPELVAEVASSMVAERSRFDALMLGAAAGRTDGSVPHLPASTAVGPPVTYRIVERARAMRRRGRSVARSLRGRAVATVASRRAARYRPPVTLTDRRGLRFELQRRAEVEEFLRHGGHFEHRELDFLGVYLQPGDTALDVGANIGAFAAVMGRAVAPDGRVHAFEPLPDSFRRLGRNLHLNGLKTVIANQLAVGAGLEKTDLSLFGPGYESWATTVPRTIDEGSLKIDPSETITVAATSIDRYCAKEGIDHIAAMKIDVEGGEPSVLEGAQNLLEARAIELVLIEVSDNTLPEGTSSHEIVELLEGHGLRPHVLESGRIVPYRPVGHVRFANVLAISEGALARAHAAAQSRAKT